MAVTTGQSIESRSPSESDPAGNINVAIPRDLHRALKIEAARQGISIKQLTIPHLWKLVEGSTEGGTEEGGKA